MVHIDSEEEFIRLNRRVVQQRRCDCDLVRLFTEGVVLRFNRELIGFGVELNSVVLSNDREDYLSTIFRGLRATESAIQVEYYWSVSNGVVVAILGDIRC